MIPYALEIALYLFGIGVVIIAAAVIYIWKAKI